jgi:hypothetical protein
VLYLFTELLFTFSTIIISTITLNLTFLSNCHFFHSFIFLPTDVQVSCLKSDIKIYIKTYSQITLNFNPVEIFCTQLEGIFVINLHTKFYIPRHK